MCNGSLDYLRAQLEARLGLRLAFSFSDLPE
jgi:hypothetical protein